MKQNRFKMEKCFYATLIKSLLSIWFLFFTFVSNGQKNTCRKNVTDCTGDCRKFIDENNDGYCDLGKLSSDEVKNIEIEKPTEPIAENISTTIETKGTPSIEKPAEVKTTKLKPEKKLLRKLLRKEPAKNKVENISVVETHQQTTPVAEIKKPETKPTKKQNHSPYDLLAISLLSILSYGASNFLQKRKIISKIFHRRIWNFVLLFSFLVSCVGGLLVSVQMEYDFGKSFLETLVFWHVEFGIIMTVIGLFHIFWHWKYFTQKIKMK